VGASSWPATTRRTARRWHGRRLLAYRHGAGALFSSGHHSAACCPKKKAPGRGTGPGAKVWSKHASTRSLEHKYKSLLRHVLDRPGRVPGVIGSAHAPQAPSPQRARRLQALEGTGCGAAEHALVRADAAKMSAVENEAAVGCSTGRSRDWRPVGTCAHGSPHADRVRRNWPMGHETAGFHHFLEPKK
jgi:hypothetical protein